ncbi:hypothetical protein BT63DRAFT_422092 [Microthyrium microscopicum]|uniref:Uncharacterized protein n=1 Tax=Microthyrium microscopicum TaxID=703497 RepID=A0A6A6URA6_9PEZI|nr:hypothetical protein BT63DRAFT_422092 [Microthyrium microscopicum]
MTDPKEDATSAPDRNVVPIAEDRQAALSSALEQFSDTVTLKELLKATLPFPVFFEEDVDPKATEAIRKELQTVKSENGGLHFTNKLLSEYLNSLPDKIKAASADESKDMRIKELEEQVEYKNRKLAYYRGDHAQSEGEERGRSGARQDDI